MSQRCRNFIWKCRNIVATYSKMKKYAKVNYINEKEKFKMKELTLKVEGMVCGGCENRVQNAVKLIDGVEEVIANHNDGTVTIKSNTELDLSKIKEKIENLDFKVID